MRGRGIAALAALVALGVAAGYGAARLTAPTPEYVDAASPVAAAGPPAPTTPATDIKPDATNLFPGPPFRFRRERVFLGANAVRVPVPEGMVRYDSVGSVRWLPEGNPSGSYSVRLTRVTQTRSQTQMVQARQVELALDTRLGSSLEIISATDSTLLVKFVLDDYRKVELLEWTSLDGSPTAQLEFAIVGRESDLDGMLALMAEMTDGARPGAPRRAS